MRDKQHASHDARQLEDRAANLKGASIALFFGFIQVLNDSVMKTLVGELGFYQVLMVRGIAVLPVIILILLWRNELVTKLEGRDRHIMTLRVMCEVGLSYFMLKALATLPLAYVIIILQTVPFGLTVAAAVFYGEAVGMRRWLAIIAGFCGVLLIVKPGTQQFQPEMLFAVTAAAIFVLRDMITRQLSAHVPTFYTVFLQLLGVTAFNLVMCFFDEWVQLAPHHYGLIVLAGVLFTLMTTSAILMMRFGDISFVAQFRYSGILWAVLIGAVLFGEIPDVISVIGALVILAAGLYALHRERLAKARALTG